jgi:hypothetical protein
VTGSSASTALAIGDESGRRYADLRTGGLSKQHSDSGHRQHLQRWDFGLSANTSLTLSQNNNVATLNPVRPRLLAASATVSPTCIDSTSAGTSFTCLTSGT